MSVYVLFLIVGLGLGALYAALALGLVLVYKGTGVVNFAQGAMAMWAAFVYDEVRKQFSEKELVDLTLAIVTINGWNRISIATRAQPRVKTAKAAA